MRDEDIFDHVLTYIGGANFQVGFVRTALVWIYFSLELSYDRLQVIVTFA